MLAALMFHAILTFQPPLTAQPVRTATSQATLIGNQPIPAFYKGYLFFIDQGHRNHIRVWAPDGTPFLEQDIEEKIGPSVMSIAVDTDSTLAVSWVGFDASGGRVAGIDFLDRNGKQIGCINTGHYQAEHLGFGADHSLWTFGWERDAHDTERAATDYMAVRKYANGREVAAYLPRSLFPKGVEPASVSWQTPGITVARDRIGVLACSGSTSDKLAWVELDFTGHLLGRWNFEGQKGVAYTFDGNLYMQDWNKRTGQLFRLDRPSSSFKPVDWKATGTLFGADGDELVFVTSWDIGPIHLSWFKQP